MEVFYIRDDGAKVKGYATYSYRNGPFGQWMVGDTPLHTIKQITEREWKGSEMTGEWRQVSKHVVALMPRTGWPGAWDAVVSAVTRKPRRTVPTDICMSVWVKGEKDVSLRLYGAQIEESS